MIVNCKGRLVPLTEEVERKSPWCGEGLLSLKGRVIQLIAVIRWRILVPRFNFPKKMACSFYFTFIMIT